MKEILIEELAYLIKEAKNNNEPQPIFFLGAGASVTGNIPLASEIEAHILSEFSDNPRIKKLAMEERVYPKLMDRLLPHQRNELLKKYIAEAKINVTHIYLAQLLKNGYVDYVLTVNFDNLMLRALALYNEFPSTYDMAILKDLTTTTFIEKSVVYLHGQHHGLWLLNTKDEMDKVKVTVPRIFDSIKNKRPWIFIGYSGSDHIFEHVKGLGRFDNGLYWVGYKQHFPTEEVQEFLGTPNTNAFYIKGYDSDAFMLKLNHALGIDQPDILKKPFSSLQGMLNEIVDITEEEHFKGVKERLEIDKKNVAQAIRQFENQEKDVFEGLQKDVEIDALKKEVIEMIITKTYDEEKIESVKARVLSCGDGGAIDLLSDLYLGWGNELGDLAKTMEGETAEQHFRQAFKKFESAIDINPDYHKGFYNWGTYLGDFAKSKEGMEGETLYREAFEKLKRAIEIKPDKSDAWYNWGTYLGELASVKEGWEAETLYREAFDKFKKTLDIKPEMSDALYNWGTYLGELASVKKGQEAEMLYLESFEKFKAAIAVSPDYHQAYYNWGTYLGDFAKMKSGNEAMELYKQSFDKFEKAVKIKPDKHQAFYNWGTNLGSLAGYKKGKEMEDLYRQSFDKFERAVKIKPDKHQAFYNWGNNLGRLAGYKKGAEMEDLYRQAFDKFSSATMIKSDYSDAFYNWGNNLGRLAGNKKGAEMEDLYRQAFDKFKKALEVRPDYLNAFYNWGIYLENLAGRKQGLEAENLYREAIGKFEQTIAIHPKDYEAFYRIGNIYITLAGIKKEKVDVASLYRQAFDNYRQAIEIKPEYKDAIYNWGAYALELAKVKTGVEADQLFDRALEMLTKAATMGSGHYNLACLHAIRGNKREALSQLEISLENKEIALDYILKDPDWKDHLKDDGFKALIAHYQ